MSLPALSMDGQGSGVQAQNASEDTLDLKRQFPSLVIIDRSVWEKHADLGALGLSVENEEPLDKRTIIPILEGLFASEKIDEKAGITILTIPKGLNFKKLINFATFPIEGNMTNIKCIWSRFSEKTGDIPVDKTYRVAIANSVLKGSRNLSVEDQTKLAEKIGCGMPEILPLATLAIMTYISSKEWPPTHLFSTDPLTYSRCVVRVVRDVSVDSYNLAVGAFDDTGLALVQDDSTHEACGVAAMKKI